MTKLPQPFGNHTTYSGHSGVDYPEASGVNIPASGPGRVTWSGWFNDRAGYATCVMYDVGCEVLYAHQLKDGSNRPPVGTRVDINSHLGKVGSTGNSTGPHLHLEIQYGNGAHTYNGVWNYFDINAVVGGSTPLENSDGEIMFIANVNGSYYVIIYQGNTKPLAVVLGADSGAVASGIPVLNFTWQPSVDALKIAVDGIA